MPFRAQTLQTSDVGQWDTNIDLHWWGLLSLICHDALLLWLSYVYCDETPEPMQLGKEKVYLTYTSISLFITKGRQDRNSNSRNWKARTDVQAIEECCLLTCSSCLAQSAFLQI